MQENLKLLVKYIVDSFWNQLVKFECLASVHSLKVKYEQVFQFLTNFTSVTFRSRTSFIWLLCLQCLETCGTKTNVNALDPRKRIDERALEKEEEDYFNENRYAFINRWVDTFPLSHFLYSDWIWMHKQWWRRYNICISYSESTISACFIQWSCC